MSAAVKAFALSNYRVREALRVGGLCQSYLAESLEMPGAGPLILKQLLPAFAADGLIAARWLEQAEANAALDDPGCLRVIDWGWAEGTGHMVVPQVPGTSLKQLLRGMRTAQVEMPIDVAVHVVRKVLGALAHAHEYVPPMVHLDVSPYSVLIRPDASLLVTEFGMWSALPVMDAARVRFERGRAHYLSPETARSQPADVRADVFSAGVMLYELLMGERPFAGNTQLVVAMAIAEGKRKPVAEHPRAARLPSTLCDVMEHMLAHDPEQRFQSARAALNALSGSLVLDDYVPGRLAALVPHAAAPSRDSRAPSAVPGRAARGQVKTAFFRGRAAKGGSATAPPGASALLSPPSPQEAAPPAWALLGNGPRAPGEHSTAKVKALKPAPEPAAVMASAPAAVRASAPPAAVMAPPLVGVGVGQAPAAFSALSPPAPPPLVMSPGLAAPSAPPRLESLAPPPLLPFAAPPPVLPASPMASPAWSAEPPVAPAAVAAPWVGSALTPSSFCEPPARISPAGMEAPFAASSAPAFIPGERSLSAAGPSEAQGVLPALRFEPLAAAQDQGRWRDPSQTLFQMKRYAEGETPKQGSRVPLPIAVGLAVIFGFAIVAGGYLLFRLAT